MDILQALEIGYKAVAIIHGSTRYKWELIKQFRTDAYNLQQELPEDSEERKQAEMLKDRWSSLLTRASWFWKFCSVGFGVDGESVKELAELAYEAAGGNTANLIDFYSYDKVKIKTPLTFIAVPPDEVIALEGEFEDEEFDVSQPTNDLYFELFQCLLLDVYRLMGVGCWLDDVLDTWPDNADVESASAIWYVIIEGAKNFLYQARSCFADTEIEARRFFNNEDVTDRITKIKVKQRYMKAKETTLMSAGGAFLINYDKLPPEWQNNVETLPAELLVK